MEGIDPFDLARALGEIPLFRELQRLLTSQQGPVNWEFAKQIARALSTAGRISKSPGADEIAEFEQACRIAEIHLGQTTGMEASTEVNEVHVLDRFGWAETALEGFEPLIDRLAVGLSGRGSSASETPAVFGGFLDAFAPLLLGIQVGFMSGYLSRRVLGQYDLVYPTGQHGRLYFVYPNIVELEDELGFDRKQFRMWLALHEVAHQLEFQSVPWLKPYFMSIVERYIDGAEIDSGEISEKLRSLADPDELARILERPNELLPMLMTNSQQSILSEIQGLMAVLEGFAEWAMDESGREMLPELDKMREGLNRRRAERSVAEKLLEQLVGLDLKLEQYRAGERFVKAVAEAGRVSELWHAPANLPSLEELAEPAKWLGRVPPA